jgi:anti-sigma B factor antagonist
MTYKVDEIGNKRIVHLDGEIDMDVADKARNTILPLIEAGHELGINLSKVQYMDSSGISVLIESKKLSEKKNTKFELIEVSKPVEKVLAMARKFL